MKKLFALVLSLCLLCSLAMAETTETTESTLPSVNWADYEAKAAEIGGEFIGFSSVGVDYKMFVPNGFQVVEVPADAAEAGVLSILSDGTLTFSVSKYSVEEITTAEEFIASLQEAKATEIEAGIINGIESISYMLTTQDGILTANVAFPTADGKEMITFTFAPADNQEKQEVLKVVAASIQAL